MAKNIINRPDTEEVKLDPFVFVPDDVVGDSFPFLLNNHDDDVYKDRMIGYYVTENDTVGLHNVTPENTTFAPLPREMTFTSDNLVSVIAYSVMFVIAVAGNLTVFITLFKTRGIKSRVNTFIMHLAIADLIVGLIMLPLETAWHISVAWLAGDLACRILMFCRAFGFYLSSFVLVTISLDRYFSIVYPLRIHDADKRGRILLTLAWVLSFASSVPQTVIFHVEKHPVYHWFEQCVTFNFFPTPTHELAYNLFNMITVYLMPLVVITVTYIRIVWALWRNAKQAKEDCKVKTELTTYPMHSARRSLLRCSTAGRIGKAKIRTLKMTLVIVSAFIICWTPYFVMLSMWWFMTESARQIDSKLQRGLFIFAVSNSCVNPILYGMFTTAFRREAQKWKDWFKSRFNSMGMFTTHSTIEQLYVADNKYAVTRQMNDHIPLN